MVLQLDTEVVGAPAVGSSLAESCGLVLRWEGVFSEDPWILEQAIHRHLGLSQSQPVLHATGISLSARIRISLSASRARTHTQRSQVALSHLCLSVKSGI